MVDDEEVCRYLLRQHLGGSRYEVIEAADGDEAMRRARGEQPDVICLDLAMPGADGFEVLRRLKADDETRDIPVVVVTSLALRERERQQLGGMVSAVLGKDAASLSRVLAAVQGAVHGPAGATV